MDDFDPVLLDSPIRSAYAKAKNFGTCLSFIGTNAVVVPDIPVYNITTALSIVCWMNPSSFPTTANRIIGQDFPTSFDSFTNTSGQLILGLNNGQFSSNSNIINTNVWQFVVITWDSSIATNDINFYVNAIPTGQTNHASAVVQSTANIYIGNKSDLSRPFTGLLDNIALYNRALSLDEIQKMYKNNIYPLSGQTLFMKFDEGQGVIAKDNSIYKNNGAVMGAQYVKH